MCDAEGGEEDQGGGAVLIRIHVPDLNIHKCLQFYRHDLVWDVKQQCLASLPKELKESFNYGLFAPPCNGKVGKFLDEERPLSDYPFSGPVGYLELRYKRRLYKGMSVEEKQLKSLHTKSNLKRFLDYVSSGHCEKVIKMCGKGLDPNFHCPETGETPLSMAALMKKPSKLLMALVNGGALLDYRTKDGSTSMHRAVEAKSLEAVKTLLDLGGSPNYRDAKGLTPLYLSVAANADPALCQALLHDHAFLGAQDLQGWHETHQACRNGLIHHLEHLLYYGADMNARNASGNTPLHVCAVNNQEPCARLLLFRGADKEALNFANQTPYQVAVIAGNMELAETIQNYPSQDVVPYRDLPKFNPKRRTVISRAFSDPRLNGSMICLSTTGSRRSVVSVTGRGPPSPCPSNRSLPPFSSASSSVSECSSSAHTQTGSCYSDSSYSEGSSHFGSEDNSAITDKSLDHSDITSDSSGVGTCNSGESGSSYEATPTDPALVLPGMMVVCVENYAAQSPKHLKLSEGDIIEVTASTDTGLLEGSLRGQIGLFPASCVQEMRMKSYDSRNHLLIPSSKAQGKRDSAGNNGKQNGKAPRLKKTYYTWGEPHTVILHRGQKGFGFILRGAKSDSPLMELQPSDRFPALQYLDDVDVNGVADRAGLRKGDFILAINGTDVSQSSHEAVVDFIRKSGELVSMTVVGLSLPSNLEQDNSKPGSPASLTCDHGSGGTPKAQYHFATLPRKYSGSSGPSVPSPPRRDPNTSLSVGRARAKSMVAALADIEPPPNIGVEGVGAKSNSVDSIASKPPLPPTSAVATNGTLQPKTASIRARPTSSRITATEIQEIFAEKAVNGESSNGKGSQSPGSGGHKIYASVSEMKRSKSGLKSKETGKLHKDFHSTPDLKEFVKNTDGTITPVKKINESNEVKSLSQESLNKLKGNPRHSWACISTANRDLLERNYENSWKGIEKLAGKDDKSKVSDGVDEGAESDGSMSSSSSSGEETPKSSVKAPVLTESEYRTIKPLRPIQSKTLPRRASTGCTSIGPVEQQTIINLVPPGQVIKVDISKSKEYASLDITSTIMSRRESNSIMSSFKPTDSAKLYASPDDLKSIGYRESGGESNNVSTLKRTVRSHSLPRGKEEVTRNIRADYAQPETLRLDKDKQGNSLTELTNGGIPSDKNSDGVSDKKKIEIDTNSGQFDPQKSLQEAKERLKPVLKSNLVNNNNKAGSNTDSTKIRIEVKQSPRLARKAEKTVTFQSEATTNSGASAAQTNGGQGQLSHSLSVDEFQKVKSSLKSSKSFPNDLGQEDHDGDMNSSSGVSSDGGHEGNYVTCVPINPDSDSSEDASDKTWILKDDIGAESGAQSQQPPSSSQLGLKRTNVDSGSQDPQLVNHNNNVSNQNNHSSVFLTSKNNTQQEPTAAHPVTSYGTLGRVNNTRPLSSGGNLTKNAVSLVKLPPPMELESESEEKSPRATPILKKPQNTVTTSTSTSPMYHTLQPQRSKSMLQEHQQAVSARQYQFQGQVQGPTRQAEKSIEESIKLIRMHVEALKDFPSVTPPPTMEYGQKSQTPILAPPPEFSDARDTHESATRFNQGHLNLNPNDPQALQAFNRASPLYRSISQTHSSNSSMYSGYPTMTRQQYQLQQQQAQQHLQMQQQHQQYQMNHGLPQHGLGPQQQHNIMTQSHQVLGPPGQQQIQIVQSQPQQQHTMTQQHTMAQQQHTMTQQQQQHTMTQQHAMAQQQQQHHSMPNYSYSSSTLGRPSPSAQSMLNTNNYGHYQTLTNVKQQQQQLAQQSPQQPPLQSGQAPGAANPFQHQHHPKCYYYNQTTAGGGGSNTSTISSTSGGGKYIPEKLHPVHRYTPDLYESTGPRIVGTIPKKQPGQDHYEVPHAHQQQLLQQQHQQQLAQQQLQQQHQQQQQGARVRREFRNKSLPEWSVGDTGDWLESLFMPEYKQIFQQRMIDGKKLLRMDNATLLELGVKKLGHRMNIEKSLKRYLPQSKT